MKCHVIKSRSVGELEEELNNWLETNPEITIKHLAQSGFYEGVLERPKVYTTVFYE
jgi:hypothetical protein